MTAQRKPRPLPEINLISWTFTLPSVTIAIAGQRWCYWLPTQSMVDQVIWLFNRGYPGKALARAKSRATRSEKL